MSLRVWTLNSNRIQGEFAHLRSRFPLQTMIDHFARVPYTSALMPKSISFWEHPINKIEEALAIRKQIAALQTKLAGLFGSDSEDKPIPAAKYRRRGKRTMSPEARERIAAAQRARWAKEKGIPESKIAPAKPAKKKGTMSAAGRAAIVAAQKARWAKIKGGTTPAPAKAKPAKMKKRTMSPEARAKIAAAAKKRWAAKKAGK